jgi:hypothetical protein
VVNFTSNGAWHATVFGKSLEKSAPMLGTKEKGLSANCTKSFGNLEAGVGIEPA